MNSNKLFVTIYGNVGSAVQDTSASMATTIKTFCNKRYRELQKRFNHQSIEFNYSFALVAGTQDYILPSDFGKEVYVYDSTNLRYIPFISMGELAEKYPDSLASQGTFDRYSIFQDAVRSQPSAASTISFTSSSAGDTTQYVRIKGTDANDVELEESVLLTGTTPAVTSNSYKSIRMLTKSGSTTGRITGTSNSGTVTVCVLAPADVDYKVLKLRAHYIPGNAATIKLPYIIKPYPLSNDYDSPAFDCADGIELGATADAWRYKRQFAKAQEFDALFERWIIDTQWDIENQPNQTKTLNVKTYNRDDI